MSKKIKTEETAPSKETVRLMHYMERDPQQRKYELYRAALEIYLSDERMEPSIDDAASTALAIMWAIEERLVNPGEQKNGESE